MSQVRVAVLGLGNCASALVQGVAFYSENSDIDGLIHREIGGYLPSDIRFVLGIDVDARKTGLDIAEAIFAAPNNTTVFQPEVGLTGAKVIRGRALDGVADHMLQAGELGFQIDPGSDATKSEIVAALQQSRAEVLVNFLPVGSQLATEFYMECALAAGVAVVNCIPVFIASDAEWEARFRAKHLPIVGDDIKAQFGATILHRVLSQLVAERGGAIEQTYQLNTGGNTDFMNMLDRDRTGSKKSSKTEAVQAALAKRLDQSSISIGPSDYVPWQKDNKVCFLRVEGSLFGGVPFDLEARLSVEDSPNSAACVLDAIRFCKVALERGEGGALVAPSAYYCKHPAEQLPETLAFELLGEYLSTGRLAAE